MSGHQTRTAKTDEWLTPPWILHELGLFDLDPCAAVGQTYTARKRFVKGQNGLRRLWPAGASIWLNPPYHRDEIGGWMRRMANHNCGVALVFARTDTAWWHQYVSHHASALYFFRGRLTFLQPDGQRGIYTGGAPSVLIGYGGYAFEQLRRFKAPVPGHFVKLDDPYEIYDP